MTSSLAKRVDRRCWCGAGEAIHIGCFDLPEGGAFPLVRCVGCGVYALFPQPDDATLSLYYSADYYGSSPRKFVWPISAIFTWFQSARARSAARHLEPGSRVLDIGCGNGAFLIAMKRRGFVAEGTEWSAEAAARVPHDTGVQVHVGDMLELDLPERGYDLITIWHVLEHLREPDEVLKKVARLLKPNGELMLALPNAESAQARRYGLHWLHLDPPRHLFNFGPRSLGVLLDRCGFEIIARTTHSLEQNVFGEIQSSLNARGHSRDRLYALIKGVSHAPFGVRAKDLGWLVALTAPALFRSTWEAMRGRGATLIVRARLRESS